MAKRSTTKELPDALREAVDRTVQLTRGSADRTRGRAQGAVDELVGTVDEIVRGAEADITRRRRAVAEAIDDRRPASHEDVKELKAELAKIGRRLEAIEERLPKPPSGASKTTRRPRAAKGKRGTKRS